MNNSKVSNELSTNSTSDFFKSLEDRYLAKHKLAEKISSNHPLLTKSIIKKQ